MKTNALTRRLQTLITKYLSNPTEQNEQRLTNLANIIR